MDKINAIQLPNTKIKILQRLLSQAIDEFRKVNKIMGVEFADRLKRVVDEYNNRRRDEAFGFEEDVVKAYSAGKNIIYLNKPTDIEKFALALADVLPEVDSERIQTACENISEYLQPQYNLLTCLRKGIIYHHGSVPDAIRIYIEDLYKKDDAVKYVITSSTLLSGVNLPAERMFILDNKRGRSNLSHDSFKNLVGRVCRFSEIFNGENGNLHRLEPQIYLVFGKYFAQNANCESFLRNVAKVEQNYKDKVDMDKWAAILSDRPARLVHGKRSITTRG